jgi:hypothetical protein
MNEQNYCSLEMSKRLVAAGIVLETEKVWKDINYHTSLAAPNWKLYPRMNALGIYVSAANLSELWRELRLLVIDSNLLLPVLVKISDDAQGGVLYSAFYEDLEHSRPVPAVYHNTNPCNCLAELLIWVKGENNP